MHRGYTKRWRKRWDNGYHHDPLMWVMMDYFIDFAQYQDKKIPYIHKGRIVDMLELKRGQCFFTYTGLATFLNSRKFKVSRKMVELRTSVLHRIGFLGHKKGRRYQVVTIHNYDKYNPLPEDEGRVKGHKGDIKGTQTWARTATVKGLRRPNKVNKDNNKKLVGQSPAFLNLKTYDKAKRLVELNIFPKAILFLNTQLKKNKNDSAISHTLTQCYLKAKNNGFKKTDAWAYCQKIINAESGNYNERDFIKEAQRQKKELQAFIDSQGEP